MSSLKITAGQLDLAMQSSLQSSLLPTAADTHQAGPRARPQSKSQQVSKDPNSSARVLQSHRMVLISYKKRLLGCPQKLGNLKQPQGDGEALVGTSTCRELSDKAVSSLWCGAAPVGGQQAVVQDNDKPTLQLS